MKHRWRIFWITIITMWLGLWALTVYQITRVPMAQPHNEGH